MVGGTKDKLYRSLDGQYFRFTLVDEGACVGIYCTGHPDLRGRARDPEKLHLYARNNQLCFHPGKEPRSEAEAKLRAREWAEYFCRYVKTGKVEG